MKTQRNAFILFLTLLAMLCVPYRASAYYDPSTQRWLNRDPVQDAEQVEGPDLYAYAGNSPLDYSDSDGQGKVSFFRRTLQRLWKQCGKNRARQELEKAGDVMVTGAGRSREGKNLAEEIWGDRVVRHDPHQAGQMPHYQHKNGGRGHVFYGAGLAGLVSAKQLLGDNVVGEAVDLFNPASDCAEVFDLWHDATKTCSENGYCTNPNLEGM